MTSGRPRVRIYNEISLDGKVTGFDGDGVRYYRRGFRWRNDAIVMGSVTAEAFGPEESAAQQRQALPPLPPAPVPPGFAELLDEPRPLLVVPDSRGRIRNLRHAQAQPWYGRIVVLVTDRTPTDHLSYLDRRGVDHLHAGSDRVDLAVALRLLAERYAIRSICTDAGGALNGALLAAGLVDEITVIVAPLIGRDPEAQSLVALPGPVDRSYALRLVEAEVLDDDALWLRYEVGTDSVTA